MTAWIHDLPKAELHVHLEGSVSPETLRQIDPSLSVDEARAGYQYDSFLGFLQSFAFVAKRLRQPAHYALAARHMFERLHLQRVQYVEVTLGAGVVLWQGQDLEAVFAALVNESRKAPLTVRWHLDAVRQWGPLAAWPVVEFAAAQLANDVVSFGLGGDESTGPASWFAPHYEFARKKGLHLTCHAGEAAGPESIREALAIGAERIGHGVRAIEDPALVRQLADRQIPLEVSVTSNIRTRVVESLSEHPIRRLYDANVPIVINTDDPALFGSELNEEYELLERQFGFTRKELEGLAKNSFVFGFSTERARF